jgi:hypothetical protein
MKKLDTILDELKEKREELKDVLNDYIKDFLVENPDVKMISLYGGTPSFNDGDPCEFYMDADCITDYWDEDGELVEYISDELELNAEEGAEMFSFIRKDPSTPCLNDLYNKLTCNADIVSVFKSTFSSYGFRVKYFMREGKFIIFEEDYEMDY